MSLGTHFPVVFPILKIIWIDILLSGDDALVIALACRDLPQEQRRWATILGAAAAMMLRILATGMVATLMALPYCRLVGAVLLLTIAVVLTLVPRAEKAVAARANLWQAVGTIALADAIMSVDNVLAIAAAARGSWALDRLWTRVLDPARRRRLGALGGRPWQKSGRYLVRHCAARLGRG